MADDYWPRLIRECTDEMMRLAAEAEKNVYDYMVPALLETQSPTARSTFYEHGSPDSPLFSQGMDWNVLKQMSPDLWAKYSDDALNLQSNELKKQANALDKLHEQEFQTGRDFERQVQSPSVFGLRTAARPRNAGEIGLNATIPMGQFAP